MSDETTSGADTQTAAAAAIATKIDNVADVIVETPKEEQDKAWQSEIRLSLEKLSAALEKLNSKPEGKSPELSALETKLDLLLQKTEAPAPASTQTLPLEGSQTGNQESAGSPPAPAPVAPTRKTPSKPQESPNTKRTKSWL